MTKTTPEIYAAREEFLNMIADGTITLEVDGDETGDHSTFIITAKWSQMRDLIDALELPNPPPCFRSDSDTVLARIEAAQDMTFDKPEPPAEPSAEIKETASSIVRCLSLIYQIGVNDGLREAVGRKKEIEGAAQAVALALDMLPKLGITFGPTKCEGCSEPATLCETCALDRAETLIENREQEGGYRA